MTMIASTQAKIGRSMKIRDIARYRGRPEGAGAEALRAAELALGLNDTPTLVYCLDLVAFSVAARGEPRAATLLLAATEAAREGMGVGPDEDEEAIRTPTLGLLDGDAVSSDVWAEGRALSLADAVELARATRGFTQSALV